MRTPVKRAPPAPRSPPASPLEEPGRSPTAERPLVCVIDGAIGAGKTTLIELLCEALVERGHKAVVVREPVEEWARCGILQEFYDHASSLEPGLVAYDFQTYTFVTRVEEVIKTKEANPDATIFLLERSVLTDRFVFMELQRELVGPRRMEMYDKWWNMWSRLMPFQPDKMVYLKPSLDKCMQRVNSRGREGEVVQQEEEEQGQEEEEEEEADSDDFLTAEEEENPGSRALDSIAEIPEPSSSAASEDDDGPDTGGGGVSSEYQERLCRAHDCYLLGQHADEFPQMPPRPFSSKDDVVVVDGALADDDFSVPVSSTLRFALEAVEHALCVGPQGKARDRTIGHIVSSLLGQYA